MSPKKKSSEYSLHPTPNPDHHTKRPYEVTHSTEYRYDEYVTDSFGRAMLAPRETAQQRIVEHSVEITPEPHILSEHVDHFGNFSHFYEVRTPHTTLTVTKRSLLEIEWPAPDLDRLNSWTVAEAAQIIAAGGLRDEDEGGEPTPFEAPPSHLRTAPSGRPTIDLVEATQYVLPSQLVDLTDEVEEYALTILPPDRPFGQALVALYSQIYRDFTYAKGTTSVKTTLPELLAQREGVCQDFAHLAVGCLRTVGIPARYVSGYIETMPPPGQVKLAGSDATHAWISAMTPDGDWIDLDPTNDHFADSRYVVTGWGRDFRDVSPLKGVIFSEGKGSKLKVAVDVIRQDRPDPREHPAPPRDEPGSTTPATPPDEKP